MIIAAVAATVDLAAAGDVDVTPLCPLTVTPGGPLQLELRLRNQNNVSVTIANSGVAIYLANLHVIGPVVKPLAITLKPFETITLTQYFQTTFPRRAHSGTFAGIGVSVLNASNKILGSGACPIEVE